MILISDYTTFATPAQRIILRELITWPMWCTRGHLLFALYGHRADGGPFCAEECLTTFVCTLRPYLHPWVSILTLPGEGYRLKVSKRQWLAA